MDYKIQCEHCNEVAAFEIDEIPELAEYIDREKEASYSDGKDDGLDEGRAEHDDISDIATARQFFDLSFAIATSNTGDAQYILDKIAGDLGDQFNDAVQRGRYNSQTRKAA